MGKGKEVAAAAFTRETLFLCNTVQHSQRNSMSQDDNHPENGLLLRSDIHTLFDLDLLGIEPDRLHVELHPGVVKEYEDLTTTTLGCAPDHRPSQKALKLAVPSNSSSGFIGQHELLSSGRPPNRAMEPTAPERSHERRAAQ